MRYAILSGDTRQHDGELIWERPDAPQYTVPLIDLHARRRKERQRILRECRRTLRQATALFLLLIGICVPLTFRITALRRPMARAQADTAQWQQRSQTLSKAGSALDSRLSDWARYEDSRDRRMAGNNLCIMLSARLPANVYLERIQIDAKTEKEQVVLLGNAATMAALQDYALALTNVPFFTNVRLTETMPFAAMGPEALHFRIEARGTGALIPPKE